MLAHGLKNRVTPAVSMAYLDDETDAEKRRRYNQLSISSLQATLDVLAGLEGFATISPSAPQFTKIDQIAEECAESVGVRLSIQSTLPAMMIDQALWRVIIHELIMNVAVHGQMAAHVDLSQLDDGRIELRLQDQGPGLGKMTPDRALEATRKDEGKPGAGMGLARAMWAAILLDGIVQLQSKQEVAGLEAIVRAFPISQN